jgi:molybdopterin biosynthesis enzyme MoaB
VTAEHAHHGALRARVAVLTVSDTRTPETDRSGAAIKQLLEEAGVEHRNDDAFSVKSKVVHGGHVDQ